jgi:hypothetical protein
MIFYARAAALRDIKIQKTKPRHNVTEGGRLYPLEYSRSYPKFPAKND